MVKNWIAAFRQLNLPEGATMDPVSKWIIILRLRLLSMTFISTLMGGVFALYSFYGNGILAPATSPPSTFVHESFPILLFVFCILGLLFAHACNNLINDYYDYKNGTDTEDYPRVQYSPHPLFSNLISARTLLGVFFVLSFLGLGIAIYFLFETGWIALLLAVIGFGISFFYVAPPLRLKHHGLGEIAIFLVWGPMMIGGTYYVLTGSLDEPILLASIPYGLGVTTVIIGKHIDKLEIDKKKNIHTLPVLLGQKRSLVLGKALMLGFYISVLVLVGVSILSLWALLILFSIPWLVRTLRIYSQPMPKDPPKNFALWPLWYVAWAYLFNERAGSIYVLGLVLHVFIPITLHDFINQVMTF